jgi:hypothetical protein
LRCFDIVVVIVVMMVTMLMIVCIVLMVRAPGKAQGALRTTSTDKCCGGDS